MVESTKVVCSHIGCKEEVAATIEFVCGSNNEETDYSCGNHFCKKHRQTTLLLDDGQSVQICSKCEDYLIDSGEWYEDPIDGCLVKLAI